WAAPRRFEEDGARFREALASQCAQACERARLFEAEHRATERQAFLAEASRVLASSLDYDATLARVARLAVPELADACGIHVQEGDRLRLAAVAHARPELEAILLAISGRDQHIARDALLVRVAK